MLIFVVEDNADTRLALQAALETAGYEVFATPNGKRALERLRSAPKPDAILLDLAMPDMSGFEVYSSLRSDPALSSIPVIVLTAAAPRHRSGLDSVDVIRKPVDLDELLFAVRRVTEGEELPHPT